MLTPPEEGTAENDGLLTASEIAQLNLSTDWVVLSACNTAAEGEPGAVGYPGSPRPFSTPAAASFWSRTGRWLR